MLRKIITSSLIITPLMASATYAFADPVFYYRHNAGVVLTAPEEPIETGEFVARNVGGNYDVLILGYRESSLAISLFDPVGGEPFYGAESWELVSGSLPKGMTAELSESNETMTFTGLAEETGFFEDIVYKVKDFDGNEVLTKPMDIRVIDDGIWLYAWPGEATTIKALTDEVRIEIGAGNVRSKYPLTYEVTGVLPSGITYSNVGGRLDFSGIADVAGTYSVTITARDDLGREDSIPITFDVVTHYKAVNSRNVAYLDEGVDNVNITTSLRDVKTYLPYTGGATWTLVSGRLPAGVTATPSSDGSQMVYSGIPTENGSFDLTWLVDDGHGNLVVTPPVKLRVGIVPDLQVVSSRGSKITLDTTADRRTVFSAENTFDDLGIPNGNWSLKGNIPAGLTLTQNSSGAVLSGIPRKPGEYQLTLTAKDTAGKIDDLALTIIVNNGVELIQSGNYYATLYADLESFAGSNKLSVRNSSTPYVNAATKWELISGRLPAGIVPVISEDKSTLRYSGSPTEIGTFSNIVWRATDGFGNTYDTRPLTLKVDEKEALELVQEGSNSDPQTIVGLPYSPRFIRVRANNAAPGGIHSTNWIVTGVPEGMSVTKGSSTLTLTGIPKKVGQYVVSVKATDSLGDEASIDLPINVVNGLSAAHYNPVSENLKQYGVRSKVTLTALITAANAPYWGGNVIWTHIRGTLPPGISVIPSSDGAHMSFTGSATEQGVYDDIVFRVTDVDGNSFETKPFTFTVQANNEELALDKDVAEIDGYVGTYINTSIAAVNIAPDQTLTADNWTISGLPDGIVPTFTNNGKTLLLRGTPTKSGSFTVNVSVTDSFGRTANSTLPFEIGAGYRLQAYNPDGSPGSSSQSLTAFVDVANREIRLENIETGELYTDGATWAMEANNLPDGITTTLSPDGSTMRTVGYPTTATSGWKTTYWNITLANGFKIKSGLSFYVSNKEIGFSSNDVRRVYKGASLSTYIPVYYLGVGDVFDLSNVSHPPLPPGISLRTQDNRLYIEGTPTETGLTTIPITVTDHFGRSATANFVLSVEADFRALPNWSNISGTALTKEINYPRALLAWKATSSVPYTDSDVTWTLESGSLPPGLNMERNATDRNYRDLRGYALQSGTWKSTWRATNADGDYVVTTEITVTVAARDVLSVTGNAPSTLTIGTASNLGSFTVQNPAFKQPIPEADWTITGLPTGMTPSISNGVLTVTGTPTQLGTFAFNVLVRDASGQTATYSRSIVVNSAFDAKATGSIVGSVLTEDFNRAMLSATLPGSSTLVTNVDLVWTLESGSMPPGLRLEKHATERNSMVLRGYAEQSGVWKMRWRATRSDGASSVTPEITVSVGNRSLLTLSGGSNVTLAPGQSASLGTFIPANTAFGQGVSSDKWTVTGLPPGFTPQVVNGNLTISGTVPTEGTYSVYSVRVKAVDAAGAEATRSFTVTVKAPFRIVNNRSTITMSKDVSYSQSSIPVLLFWDDGNNYVRTVKNLALVSGSLPPGMAMAFGTSGDALGQTFLSGTPTEAGTYKVRYQVESSTGIVVTATSDLVIIVN